MAVNEVGTTGGSLMVVVRPGLLGAPVVLVRGELDFTNRDTLDEKLAFLQRTGTPLIIVDLRGLTFIDSAGLHVLVRADRRARELNTKLMLVRPQASLMRVFNVAGLDERLTFVATIPGEGRPDPGVAEAAEGAQP